MALLTLNADETLTLQFHDDVEQPYQVTFAVCSNPLCICQSIDLTLSKLGATTDETHKVSFNLIPQQRNTQSPCQDPAFAQALLEQMTEADWLLLAKLYYKAKQACTEAAIPEEIDAHFPQHEIETEGLMLGYCEVLPYAERFEMEIDGNRYWLDDQYCVKTRCDCQHVVISLIPLDGAQAPPKDIATIEFTYTNKKWTLIDSGCRDKSFVQNVVEKIDEPQRQKFLERHKKLRQLYMLYKKRHGARQVQKLPRKIFQSAGRNDPCPCGSGKKYKRCCLGKEDNKNFSAG